MYIIELIGYSSLEPVDWSFWKFGSEGGFNTVYCIKEEA